MPAAFGQTLQTLMKQNGWSPADLAKRTGLSTATITRYLRGGKPSADSLLRLSRTLGIDPWTLYGAPSARLEELSKEWSDDDCPRWSYSKLTDYLRCPAYFYFRHVVGLEAPSDPDAVVGSAAHAGIEQVLRAKAGMDAQDPKVAVTDRIKAEEPFLGPDDEGNIPDPEQLAKESWRLVQVYQDQIAPTFEPVAVEQRMEATIAGVRVTCVLDVIDSEGRIHDTKTSKRKPAQTDLDENLQATMYDIAFTQNYGQPPKGMVFDYLLRRKNGIEAMSFPIRERTDADRNRLARIVEEVVQAAESGRYYPNPLNKYGCGRCPFRDACYEEFGGRLPAKEQAIA